MAVPRGVYPGESFLTTRRANERRFYFKPDRMTDWIMLYCLACAAEKYAIDVHAFCVLSNHAHEAISDPEGNLTLFRAWRNGISARAMNAYLGRRGYVWEPPPDSKVTALDAQVMLNQVVYTLANPVTSGLVRSARGWPGVWSDPRRVEGKPYRVERPPIFFGKDHASSCPPVVYLQLTKPRQFVDMPAEEYRELLEERLREKEEETRADFARTGQRFVGKTEILKASRFERGSSEESEFKRHKKFAGSSCDVQVAEGRHAHLVKAHRQAVMRSRAGDRDVVFPYGTDSYRRRLGVLCEPRPKEDPPWVFRADVEPESPEPPNPPLPPPRPR